MNRRVLLAATLSAIASLVYEVSWSRQVALIVGHSVTASAIVVAAFMGGLGVGAALAARYADRLSVKRAIVWYAALELAILLQAILLSVELPIFLRVLRSTYGGAGFDLVRVAGTLTLLFPATTAMGATFPLALRACDASTDLPRRNAALYAVTTLGAAFGAFATGFVALPRAGNSGALWMGVSASLSAVCLLWAAAVHADRSAPTLRNTGETRPTDAGPLLIWFVGLCGAAGLASEMAWMRALAPIVGPTTYAFASTVGFLILGTAMGALYANRLAQRRVTPSLLAAVVAATAVVLALATSLVGADIPRLAAAQGRPWFLRWNGVAVSALIAPAGFGLGLAFPLAVAAQRQKRVSGAGMIYATNTLCAMAGALVAPLIMIPLIGTRRTLDVCVGLLLIAAMFAVGGQRVNRARSAAWLGLALMLCGAAVVRPWRHELIAAGAYKYARTIAGENDREARLAAGALLYYREGATATVSVRRLAGVTSLSLDGKVDASTGGDMLTQKLLAHVPLLLRRSAKTVLIVGLGSGVTVASSLTHAVERVDVVELSPEVIDASAYFKSQNRGALSDPRTRVIRGDGRTHLLLSPEQYDVIISEPSNPWIAGIASLFTREFFTAAAGRLAPGGVICQWIHTYDIRRDDFRSVLRTFLSVFPNGTVWMIGRGDVLLVAANEPLEDSIRALRQGWPRGPIADDLEAASVKEPFQIVSSFVADADDMRTYLAGAALQTDDRQQLEFSGPRALDADVGDDNAADLRAIQSTAALRLALLGDASAREWVHRGDMLLRIDDAQDAYADYRRAIEIDASAEGAGEGLVTAALATGRQREALAVLRQHASAATNGANLLAESRLLAATGAYSEAVAVATSAWESGRAREAALQQLASIFADLRDAPRLERVVARLSADYPDSPRINYYRAALHLLKGELDDAKTSAERNVATHGNDGAGYNLLGNVLASRGELDAARNAFVRAAALAPNDDAVYANLGLLALRTDDRAAAYRYFAEALAVNPVSNLAQQGLREVSATDTR